MKLNEIFKPEQTASLQNYKDFEKKYGKSKDQMKKDLSE